MNIIERVKAPTPKFFKVLRNVGLTLLAGSGTLLAAPVALPAVLLKVAGYIAVAGTVASAVSQTAVENGGGNPSHDPIPKNGGGSPIDPPRPKNGGGSPSVDGKN